MAQKGGAVTWRAGLDPNGNVSSYQRDSQLTKYHGAPSGIFLADECLAGTMPSRGSETCLVVEQLFSMNVVHEIQGDAFFAERAETIAYNALPSTGTKDMWTRVYLQQPNEVFGGHTDPHPWETDGDDSTTYSLGDNYFCCTANFNQGWPRFVQRMLHASPDGGVAVSVLGPVSAVGLPGGAAVNVSGGYPFDSDDVTVTLSNLAPGAVAYPLYIRVPSWAANATLALADGSGPTLPVGAAAGTMLKVDWSALGGPAGPAVAVTLATAPAVRVEPHFNGALAVFRGPLLYSLRLDETFVVTTSAPGEPRAVDYVVEQPGCDRPNSGECAGAWNAALVAADAGSAAAGFTFSRTGPAPAVPFAAGLWGASNLEMMAQVRLVNSWGLALGSAAPPPSSPVDCSPSGACGDVYTATFVPFGATHLRISQLPYTPVPPCGSDVGYNASGVTTLPGGVDGASWDAYGGASITANGPDVNIRSGDPGDVGTAAYTATLRAPGHKVTGLALNFSYVAGYGGDGAPGGAVLSVVALAPGPCGGGAAPGPPLATLYTSAPLEHYPFDSNPRGYSPANPVVLPRGAFSLDASSGVVLAFRITNNQRNIQLKLPLPVTVWWD